jgi:hypothetical protein
MGSDDAPKTVYVVTTGSYSDYHIVAIFDTRGVADALVTELKAAGKWTVASSANVEEWALNVRKADVGPAWEVYIDFDGNVTNAEMVSYAGPGEAPYQAGGEVVGYGASMEHARRSAEELRRQLKVVLP